MEGTNTETRSQKFYVADGHVRRAVESVIYLRDTIQHGARQERSVLRIVEAVDELLLTYQATGLITEREVEFLKAEMRRLIDEDEEKRQEATS